MNNSTFDLKGLVNWGVDKAVSLSEQKTGLPLGELIKPMANAAITSMGIQAVEIDPIIYMMGRLAYMGIERQKKITEARNAELQGVKNGSG